MSNFLFIDDKILQSNLDTAFDHIVKLVSLSLSSEYKEQPALVSSLRKTIIIHTAAIVEALLLWKLKQFYKTGKVELQDEWKYFDVKSLYIISDTEEVVAGKRKKERKNVDKLDFLRITDLCSVNHIITLSTLRSEIDKVRFFRNRLHIGSLTEIEKEYSKSDLEFCFGVAKKVKKLVSR